MNHPPPHSFSRSPVEEVICRCVLGYNAESLSLTIPGPYPGWPKIRERIREMVDSVEDISRITGAMLIYTDLFPVLPGVTLPEAKDIEQILSGEYNCHTVRDKVVFSCTSIPGTAGTIRSLRNSPKRPGWTLVFSVQTEGQHRFASCDLVVVWFDDAHAAIHNLFDRIVPEDIVQALR